MQVRPINASAREINLSITESDVGTLYIIQHELLKGTEVDFAGVIVKHPLTNEIWMRVHSVNGDPIKHITKATETALNSVDDLRKLLDSKIRVG